MKKLAERKYLTLGDAYFSDVSICQTDVSLQRTHLWSFMAIRHCLPGCLSILVLDGVFFPD